MGATVAVLPHRNLILSAHDHAALAGRYLGNAGNDRLSITARVEILRIRPRVAVELGPGIRPSAHAVGDKHSGRRAIADAATVEAGGKAKSILHPHEGNAIGGVGVLIDPAPLSISHPQTVADPC